MRQSVRDAFFDYSAKREGFTPFMYADTLNLVTTGIGNLIDAGPRNSTEVTPQAMAPAMSIPWEHKTGGWSAKNPVTDGVRASQSEIAECWAIVKHAGIQQQGGFAYANIPGNSLSLTMDGLKQLFTAKMNANDKALAKHYTGYETWPADAQLAIMSMAWAMGAAFHPVMGFQSFKDAVDRLDFGAAKSASEFKGGGRAIDPVSGMPDEKTRNGAHRVMFENAALVLKAGADPDRLFFPGTVDSPAPNLIPFPIAKTADTVNKVATAGAVSLGLAAVGYAAFEWWRNRK